MVRKFEYGFAHILLIIIPLILIVSVYVTYFIGMKSKMDISIKEQFTDTKQSNNSDVVLEWPENNYEDTAIFISSHFQDVFLRGDIKGENLQASGIPLRENFSNVVVKPSPDRSKVLYYTYTDSESIDSDSIYSVSSIDGEVVHDIDFDSFKDIFGSQYNIEFTGWSEDSLELVFRARDMENFLDDSCCEGGDFRPSKQILFSYNLQNNKTKVLVTKTTQPLGFLYYNPKSNILVYDETGFFPGPEAILRNLANNEEIVFESTVMYQSHSDFNISKDYKYILRTVENGYDIAGFDITFIEDPFNIIGKVRLENGGSFSNSVLWSPDYKYFAVNVTRLNGEMVDLTKIYTRNGEEVSSINKNLGRSSIFSSDSKMLLVGPWVEEDEWEIFDVLSGQKIDGPFVLPLVAAPIAWFN